MATLLSADEFINFCIGSDASWLGDTSDEQHLAKIEEYLKAGQNPNEVSSTGNTVFAEVVALRKIHVVKKLHQYGGDVNSKYFVQGKGDPSSLYSLLDMAFSNDLYRSETFFFLVKNRANVFEGQRPLLYASAGDLFALQALTEDGENVNEKTNYHLFIPLMIAVMADSPECCQILLNMGADVHVKNDAGFNALSYTIGTGSLEMAKLLIAHGADPYQTVGSFGRNFFENAKAHHKQAFVNSIENSINF